MLAPLFFTEEDREQVRRAIQKAETATSGEIRVYVEDKCKASVLDRAAYVFEELKMHETERRNGILIYLAMESRLSAILGDVGINLKTGERYWPALHEQINIFFREGRYIEGLLFAIQECGDILSRYFPMEAGDRNELSDDMVFGPQ